MKFATQSEIAAVRERVFAALVDPDVLRRCLPGCDELVAIGEDVFEATLKIGVAGLKGSYRGRAEVRDKLPAESFTLRFDGKGGPGFVRGAATIRLTDDQGTTRVVCDADIQVGGPLAAVGSRLIEATARKLAGDFFSRLSEIIGQDEDHFSTGSG